MPLAESSAAPQLHGGATDRQNLGPLEWCLLLLCVAVVFLGLIHDPLLSTAAQIVQKAVWLGAVFAGLHRYRPANPWPWLCVAGFLVVTALRNVIRLLSMRADGGMPFVAGAPFELASILLSSALLIAASILIMRARRPQGDW